MNNISKYQGVSQFGSAYKTMLENDTHAPGSIDRVLTEGMIRLCPETMAYLYGGYTPTKSLYIKGSRPELEQYLDQMILVNHSKEEQIQEIMKFISNLQHKISDDLDLIQFGGTEEEIIARGSDWCTDLARVGCVLCQIAGYPARVVHLFDLEKPYSGHEIVEVYRDKVWGAADPLRNVVYHNSKGEPVSALDLMNDRQLIENNYLNDQLTALRAVGQFSGAAISNYYVWQWKDMTIQSVN
ncbi:MAG: transglutaminase domain-containing protein [Patescibacteria group bacterium]|jgi:transglutaminase-like putative cysteine protease